MSRVHAEGTFAHYVTFGCNKNRKLLSPDRCKRIVLGQLAAQLKRQNAICVGFIVMPDHVHALVWFPEEFQISEFMGKWKELSSREIAKVYERDHLEYWSKLEDDPEHDCRIPRYHDFLAFIRIRNCVRNWITCMPTRCARDWSGNLATGRGVPARWWIQGKPVGVALGVAAL